MEEQKQAAVNVTGEAFASALKAQRNRAEDAEAMLFAQLAQERALHAETQAMLREVSADRDALRARLSRPKKAAAKRKGR